MARPFSHEPTLISHVPSILADCHVGRLIDKNKNGGYSQSRTTDSKEVKSKRSQIFIAFIVQL
jgi:hypothetical protein